MATLKISDLSVGDWVEIDHEDYGWQQAQINVCGDLGIGAYFKDIDPEEEHDCTLSQARPIPITPEILKANGWQRNEEDEYMEYYGDPTSGIAHTKGTCHYRLEAPEVSVVCYFVHQLQHALRLAGVEKEIVMPNK